MVGQGQHLVEGLDSGACGGGVSGVKAGAKGLGSCQGGNMGWQGMGLGVAQAKVTMGCGERGLSSRFGMLSHEHALVPSE